MNKINPLKYAIWLHKETGVKRCTLCNTVWVRSHTCKELPLQTYNCPKCNLEFQTIEQVKNHYEDEHRSTEFKQKEKEILLELLI